MNDFQMDEAMSLVWWLGGIVWQEMEPLGVRELGEVDSPKTSLQLDAKRDGSLLLTWRLVIPAEARQHFQPGGGIYERRRTAIHREAKANAAEIGSDVIDSALAAAKEEGP